MCLGAAMTFIPQMLYWNWAFGSPVVWSYEGEGFTSLSDPKLFSFLFSTNNGLLPYSLVMCLVVWGCVINWRAGDRGLLLATGLPVVLVTFLGASWWVWHFGCGFGSRTLVEYSAMLAFPLCTWLKWSVERWGRLVPTIIGLSISLVTIKMIYSYGDCWFHGDWNWSAYANLILGPTK